MPKSRESTRPIVMSQILYSRAPSEVRHCVRRTYLHVSRNEVNDDTKTALPKMSRTHNSCRRPHRLSATRVLVLVSCRLSDNSLPKRCRRPHSERLPRPGGRAVFHAGGNDILGTPTPYSKSWPKQRKSRLRLDRSAKESATPIEGSYGMCAP